MDKHFETSRNLCLALNEAYTLIHHAHRADRPDWIDDVELHHSLAKAAREAAPGVSLGAVRDQNGRCVVLPVLGNYWVCHRSIHSSKDLVRLLSAQYPDRQFTVIQGPMPLDQANPVLVQIAADTLSGFGLDQSIGLKSIFSFT